MNNGDTALALGRFANWNDNKILAFRNLLDAYDAAKSFKEIRALVNDATTDALWIQAQDAVRAAIAAFRSS